MLQSPPQEKECVSWLFAVLWSLSIFYSVPKALVIQHYVRNQWGSEAFSYTVYIVIVITILMSACYLLRIKKDATIGNFLILALIALIFIAYTRKLESNPEEALHFVEYGVLGVLLYRALCHRIQDISIYFIAASIGISVGVIDETLQWITPGRIWSYQDLWLNSLAILLVQIGIAKGLKPPLISGKLRTASVRLLSRSLIVICLLFGLSLLNTPTRVAWYAKKIPVLEFLNDENSWMFEYGYRYQDPEIGVFRSRFVADDLYRIDRTSGANMTKTLDRYQPRDSYATFLKKYTPLTAPFLHEMRVHLYRRNEYLRSAKTFKQNDVRFAENITVAYRENLILEKYFTHTLKNSAFVLPPEELIILQKYQIGTVAYDSSVSKHLITLFNDRQVMFLMLLLILSLVGMDIYLGQHRLAEDRD